MMAVRRIGDEATRVQTRSLGRVLVTIDDLKALQDLISTLERDSGVERTQLKMGFNGGEFDNAEDLLEMTDEELHVIWVRSSNVEVVLGVHVAEAIGRLDIVEAVQKRWARVRLTREKGHLRIRAVYWPLNVALIAFISVAAREVIRASTWSASWPVLWSYLIAAAVFLTLMVATGYRAFAARPNSYAVIRAMTLAEYRVARNESAKHWRTIALTAIGTCVALAGLLVSTFARR